MRLSRSLLALVLVGLLAGVAYVAQRAEPTGAKMAHAADKFLDSLTDEQKAKATFSFDDKERTHWYFTPYQKDRKPARKGLPLAEMTAEQRQAALDLLKTGTSASGDRKALTIMSLESILRDLEKGGAMVRNPNWYFFTVFGKPARKGKWGWRVEGHHLSLNFTVEDGQVVAATPAFFGANPATVRDGKRKGLRTLPDADDLAGKLFKSLDEDQKKVASQKDLFPEIAEATAAPKVGEPKGLAADKMTQDQHQLLMDLLHSYTDRMPEDIAEAEMSEVKKAGIDKIHFAYAGGLEPGKRHTYRVQGPTFVIEFLNVQPDSANNPANHIHSAWRHIGGDFGLAAK
ncbi:MAG TPA: DUF3500 domain-containing protein [Gemmataceae bacterium]|jgi:hypothetical protein|nr:DUF3500 domain-containing protein [Gemmataceae bacterium]